MINVHIAILVLEEIRRSSEHHLSAEDTIFRTFRIEPLRRCIEKLAIVWTLINLFEIHSVSIKHEVTVQV